MTAHLNITTYKITKTTGFYPELNTLLISLQSVAIAAELYRAGKVQTNPGDYVTIEAKHLLKEVRLPLYGPVQAAMMNAQPDEIHLSEVHGKTKSPLLFWTSGFQNFVDALFLPFLVNFHQRNRDALIKGFSQDRTSWPAAWQMSWALRNAASHGGKVFEKATQKPVMWQGITFGPGDEPAKCLTSMVNGADLLLLMIEMEESLCGNPISRI